MKPLIALDFEASALDPKSYPIEVGLALATGFHSPVLVWSSLVRPSPEWLNSCGWDSDAQRIHGISPRELTGGAEPRVVAQALNRMVGPVGEAWCDGGNYDALWLDALFRAAGLRPAFRLGDITDFFAGNRAAQDRYAEILRESRPPHRAGPDAARIVDALVRAAGGEPAGARTIEPSAWMAALD